MVYAVLQTDRKTTGTLLTGSLCCLSEEKSSRGGNKETRRVSFLNPCLWRGFIFEIVSAAPAPSKVGKQCISPAGLDERWVMISFRLRQEVIPFSGSLDRFNAFQLCRELFQQRTTRKHHHIELVMGHL